MDYEVEIRLSCPYCGSEFERVVDTSEGGTVSTIEDCETCCRPISLNLHCRAGNIEWAEVDRA